MKKLVVFMLLSIPVVSVAQSFEQRVQRAIAKAAVRPTVKVSVKLAKPVYMSDVMFRRPRGKNMVIGTDYKQNTCTGVVSDKQVYVPATCVVEKEYRPTQVILTFANGRNVQKAGRSVKRMGDVAVIAL